jgi:type IV pilus assembly protein PilC
MTIFASHAPSTPPKVKRELMPKRVGAKDLMQFSRQLSAFVRAGIPILDGLALLEEDTPNPTMKATLAAMADSLRRGEPFSVALEQHPKVFPNAYRSMLRSAELTGNLDTVLDQVSRYLERDVETRSKIKAALVYPAIIMAMSAGVVILLTTFVLPKFKTFFTSFHQKLPLATRMLLNAANFVGTFWWAIVLGLVVLAAGAVWGLRDRRGRMRFDRFVLTIPLIGQTLRFAMVERFCRILASMTAAGVGLPDALDVAGAAMGNRHIAQALATARDDMMQGQGIAGPLSRSTLFPPAAVQMLRVGEDTGQLDSQLEAAASYYEHELDYKIKKVVSLFEPAVLVFMGLIVGFVAVALVSAMYGIFSRAGVG